jgi:SAM-dependent methyltransferase
VYPRIAGDIPVLIDGTTDALRGHDVLGDLDVDLVERIHRLELGSDTAERAFRSTMYVRSHYLDRPTHISAIWDGLLSRIETPIETAVDLGCSVGGMVLEVAHRTRAQVVGLDSDPLALRWAQLAARGPFEVPLRRTARHVELVTVIPPGPPEAGRVQWLCADAINPPLCAEAFDLVMVMSLLDSVPNPGAVLAQASALLRPNGYLLIAQPDAWSSSSASPEHWLAEDDAGWDAVLAQLELRTLHRIDDVDWVLHRTDRCRFGYRLHARLAVRG